MIRRTVLPLACMAVLSGCATFTQDDVVASYNDDQLDQSEFDDRYERIGGDPIDGRFQGDAARAVVTNWIYERVLAEAGVIDRYELGPEASGILCVSLVRPTDLNEAQGYVDRLEGGEAWSDLLAADFPDVPANGDVDCIPTQDLGPLAPQVAGITLDNPYEVFLFDDQSVAVLRMRPTTEIDPLEIAGNVQTIDPESIEGIGEQFEAADITVDPQFGQFDGTSGQVVPVG
ncbi:MAG: hypothetical protein ACLGHQ_11215 [Acidimicrobiia bacterium]